MEADAERKSVVAGAAWMVGLSLLLFFLPAINGLIGGLVGGYKIGDARRALMAALLPAAVVALGLWILLSLAGVPVVGVIGGAAVAAWILVSEVGLLGGALLGGLSRSMRRPAPAAA